MKNIRILLVVSLFVSLVVLGYQPLHADATRSASADTYVRVFEPDLAHNGDGLGVTMMNFPVVGDRYELTYIRFDLSGTWGGALTAATLRLYLLPQSQGTGVIGVYPSAWDGDEAVTWNTDPVPPESGPQLDTQNVAGGVGTWVEFDVTAGTTLGGFVSFVLEAESAVSQGMVIVFEDSENSKGSGNTPELFLEGAVPTAVTLTSFTTTPLPGAIRVDWETASETGLLGFNLYRAVSPGSTPERLNDSLIPVQGTAAAYDYLDSTVRAGDTYYYWLDLVDIYSHSTRHGPQSATAGLFRFYLPVIVR